MKPSCLLLYAALGAPVIVSAQTARLVPAAADADAAVAPLHYRSVFAELLPAAEPKPAPDQNWLQANRLLGGGTPEPSGSATTAEVAPAAVAAQAAAAGDHKHQNGLRQ